MTKRAIAKERRVVQPSEQSATATRTYLIWGGVALGVILLGVLLALNLREPGAIAGITRFAGLSRGHTEDATYPDTGLPPAGGLHSSVWQNCGIYDQPIDSKNVVHSLEHGAVWLTYSPELPEDDVEELRDMARGEPYVLMSPFPGQRSDIVLTAWGIQLEVDSVNDNRIETFIDRYQQGPQTPEFGGACSGGVGTPIE